MARIREGFAIDGKEMRKLLRKLIAKAWSDAKFKAKLMADPASVLRTEGMEVPEGMKIHVFENTEDRMYLVIPNRPENLTDEELDFAATQGPIGPPNCTGPIGE